MASKPTKRPKAPKSTDGLVAIQMRVRPEVAEKAQTLADKDRRSLSNFCALTFEDAISSK